jgi:hypothetical protein
VTDVNAATGDGDGDGIPDSLALKRCDKVYPTRNIRRYVVQRHVTRPFRVVFCRCLLLLRYLVQRRNFVLHLSAYTNLTFDHSICHVTLQRLDAARVA